MTAVWCAALAALCGLLAPGDWRLVALVPVLGFVALLAFMRPYRPQHADRARLELVPPVVNRGESMILDAEREWRERYGITADEGGWASGTCANDAAAVWPNPGSFWAAALADDDPSWPGAPSLTPGQDAQPGAGVAVPPSLPAPAPGVPLPAPLPPAERTGDGSGAGTREIWADRNAGRFDSAPGGPADGHALSGAAGPPALAWPPPTRKADTAEAFRAPLFADCLAFMRHQDADTGAYVAGMADDAATFLLQLREAW